MLELAAPLGGVREIAVVAEGDLALVAVDHDGLSVEQGFVARGRVARVADGEAARELCEHAWLENFFDFAHRAMDVQLFAVAGNDAGGFLAAMLQGVETEIGEVRRFRMAEDAEDTTLVVEVIVENLVRLQGVVTLSCLNFAHVAGSMVQTIMAAIGRPMMKLWYSMRSIALARKDSKIAKPPTIAASTKPQGRYL